MDTVPGVRLPFLAQDPLAREFKARGPWVSRFRIEGRDYGGKAELVDDERIRRFAAAFPDCASILELGSLEGAHSISLARRADRVVAVEGRSENIARARFVQELFGVENVEVVEADLETTPLTDFGRFDAIFCVGLLYHLPRPWLLLDQFAAVAPNVFLADALRRARRGDRRRHARPQLQRVRQGRPAERPLRRVVLAHDPGPHRAPRGRRVHGGAARGRSYPAERPARHLAARKAPERNT